jgi:hypothetical protein
MPIRVERLESGDYEVSDIMDLEVGVIYKENELPDQYKDKIALLYLQEPGLTSGYRESVTFGWRFSDTVFYLNKEGL